MVNDTEFGEEFSVFLRSNFLRFLDDCFVIWPPDKDIEKFKHLLNNQHPDIRYTMEIKEKRLPFLDICVELDGVHLSTDLYSKSTDSHNYLDFFSSHVKHTKVNIPFNLASRLVTIVSDEARLEERLDDLKCYL